MHFGFHAGFAVVEALPVRYSAQRDLTFVQFTQPRALGSDGNPILLCEAPRQVSTAASQQPVGTDTVAGQYKLI